MPPTPIETAVPDRLPRDSTNTQIMKSEPVSGHRPPKKKLAADLNSSLRYATTTARPARP